MGQKPITFIRQVMELQTSMYKVDYKRFKWTFAIVMFIKVLALVSFPELMDKVDFPSDVKAKAQGILSGCKGGSAGSYSDSNGIELIRQHAAEYITRRDGGIPSNPDDVVLCAGASEGIRVRLLPPYSLPLQSIIRSSGCKNSMF
jgi:aspartate/methionine/tyrosine aminotransferase